MFGDATALYERARNWTVGSDPGLLRLRMATRTTGALATALLLLFLLTRATGQPLTVALLGVLISMISARSVNEPDPRRQRITMALLPLPTAVAITAAALLSPHPVAADVGFVLVVFTAAYVRRFGPRGTALGMVTFMSYFFSLYLRAKFSELPWLIGATLVGSLCSFIWSVFLMPDRPESVLRESIRSLRARMAIVVDTTADIVRGGQFDERRGRRLRIRTGRLNATALMVQAQIEDRVNPGALWPGVSGEDLALWLFDAELTVERLATAGSRAAMADLPAATRAELADTVAMLSRAVRIPHSHGLLQTAERAQQLIERSPDPDELPLRRLALAIVDTAKATAEVRAQIERVTTETTTPADIPGARRAATPGGPAAVHSASHSGGRRRGAGHRRRRSDLAIALVLGGDRGVRDFRRHQLMGRDSQQGLAAPAGHGARCAQRCAGRYVGVGQHHRLAGDDLRMSVLRFLFHEGHLQPDDLLDQHHAGVDVRPARRVHLQPAAVADRGDRGRGGTRDRRRHAGVADQHPDPHPPRRPHVLPHPVGSRRRFGHQPARWRDGHPVDRDGASTRPRPAAVPDQCQAAERRSGRPGRAPQHAARLEDADRVRPLRANPGPQQRTRIDTSAELADAIRPPPRRFAATSTC